MAKEIETGEIVALKKIRTNDEREGVSQHVASSIFEMAIKFLNRVWHEVSCNSDEGDQDPQEASSSKRHQFERGCVFTISRQ